MNNTLRDALISGLILTVASMAAPKDSPQLHLNVRIYDYAKIPAGLLDRALRETTHILEKSGVRMSWQACPLSAEELENNPDCNKSPSPADVMVRILPREMSAKLAQGNNVYGIAASVGKGDFGKTASIFYHNMVELADRQDASKSLLLGHLIAYELGHLLLGSNSHSGSGLMHVPWTKQDLQRASKASLLFTKKESRKIQANVTDRLTAEQLIASR